MLRAATHGERLWLRPSITTLANGRSRADIFYPLRCRSLCWIHHALYHVHAVHIHIWFTGTVHYLDFGSATIRST